MFPSLYSDVSDVVHEFRRIVMMPAACLKVKRSISSLKTRQSGSELFLMDWQGTNEHSSRQNNECIANLSKAPKYLLSPKLRKFESRFFYEKTVTPQKKGCKGVL